MLKAKFKTTCKGCSKTIQPGEAISRHKGSWQHEWCANSLAWDSNLEARKAQARYDRQTDPRSHDNADICPGISY